METKKRTIDEDPVSKLTASVKQKPLFVGIRQVVPYIMKILVIAPTPFFSDRGTHIRILEEALALERLGHTVKIVTYHIGNALPTVLRTNIDVRRIRRLLFWYRKLEAGPDWQKIILDVMLIRKAFYLARTWQPDILHAHLHEGLAIGWVVQKSLFWRRMKLVADFHGSLTKEMVSHSYLRIPGLRWLFQTLERWIDNMGDTSVASSWDNADEISRIRTKNKVATLLDGTRLSMFEGLSDQRSLREKYHVPLDKIVIVYTGALIPNKGISLILEAIPLVCERYPQAHFVIAGFPVDQIRMLSGEGGYGQPATIISPLSYFALPEILTMCDIAVDPKESSVRQASGKMLNYMGAGLPVACFDTPNNRAYLGEDGAFAKAVTAEGLAAAIGTLIESPWRRDKYGRGAKDRAIRFSWEKSAKQLEKIYLQLMD